MQQYDSRTMPPADVLSPLTWRDGTDGAVKPGGVRPRFYVKPQQKRIVDENGDVKELLDAEGKPQIEFVEHVELVNVGDSTCVIQCVARENHKRMYAREYQAFKEGVPQQQIDGTPLSELPGIVESVIQRLNLSNVYSIEQLVDCPEHLLDQLGRDIKAWREVASNWLERARGNAEEGALAARIAAMESQVAKLTKERDEAQSRAAGLEVAVEHLSGVSGEEPVPDPSPRRARGKRRKAPSASVEAMNPNATLPEDAGAIVEKPDHSPNAFADDGDDPVDALMNG